jgi:hypothetical protein
VGLVPLFAVVSLEAESFEKFPHFTKRMKWFIQHRPDLSRNVASMQTAGVKARKLLAIVSPDRLRCILQRMLDENEFLSPYGVRAVSKFHASHPYSFNYNGQEYRIDYEPAESTTSLFGGNSNWRGPVWFPVNHLIIESLQKFYHFLGDDFTVECPTGSGHAMTLLQVATELARRLIRTFLKDESGQRPIYGGTETFQTNPHWRDLILFNEYFHGDNGAGLGASHQTGWTGLVAVLIQQYAATDGDTQA